MSTRRARPAYLEPKATHLPEGHDESLDNPEARTDAVHRSRPPVEWPWASLAKGGTAPPDGPLGPPPLDPALRSLPPFEWPRAAELASLLGDLDPDVALWPVTPVQRWPFTGPPSTGVWPTGWVGVDNAAVPWICTVGGQPGTWAPLGPSGLGWVTPDMFGAVGDGVTDDTHAVQAAFSASTAVFIPAGKTYAVSAPIVPHPTAGYTGGLIQGAGLTSIIKWTTLGHQATCEQAGEDIALDLPNGYVVRDVQLQGPANVTPGQNNVAFISGLTVPIDGILDHVYIQGFHSGLVFKGANHTVLRRVRCNNNFYGAIWVDYAGGVGNLYFESCHWNANALAAWKFGAQQYLAASEIIDCDWSSNPWAILCTDGFSGWDTNNNPQYAGTQPSTYQLQGSLFRNMDCEGMGNGVFLDISSWTIPSGSGGKQNIADIFGCRFSLIGVSLAGANGWNKAPIPAAYQNQNFAFYCGFSTCVIDLLEGFTYGTPNIAPLQTFTNFQLDVTFINCPFVWWAIPVSQAMFQKLFTANHDGVTWPAWPSQTPRIAPKFISSSGMRQASIEQVSTNSAAITAGMLLQLDNANGRATAATTNTRALWGVALSASTAGSLVVIAKRGLIGDTTACVITTGAVTGGAYVTFDATTFTSVAPWTPSATTYPPIGYALGQVGAGAAVGINLFGAGAN